MSTSRQQPRILGVDPGSRITGWGLIEVEGSEPRWLDHGVIRLHQKAPLPERLSLLYDGMTSLLSKTEPDEVAVEELYVARNARSAL
ncbi:MAG: crossover junction endodeoxyribonuclease RuvC, partial [Candidatus Latescibacteria bacterium]|nr:crossover junction endodeoxyribonuclease RuvC [Candidatus Latescibacterota bacterium]